MSTICAFDHIENKHTLYCGKDCMKKFCSSLREHAVNILNFEKKKMLPLTKEELKLHQVTTTCYICGEKFLKSSLQVKIIAKLEIIVIMQVNMAVQHIVFAI